MYCTSTQMKKPSCACLRIYERKEKDTMLKSFVTLIITLIVGVVFMAIGNDFFNGFTDIGVIFAVAVAGTLIVFFNEQKGK